MNSQFPGHKFHQLVLFDLGSPHFLMNGSILAIPTSEFSLSPLNTLLISGYSFNTSEIGLENSSGGGTSITLNEQPSMKVLKRSKVSSPFKIFAFNTEKNQLCISKLSAASHHIEFELG